MEKTIKDVFIDELHDMLSAEQQIVKALPKVVEAASSPDLKAAFRAHLQETKGQIKRLEKAFRLLKHKPRAQLCKAAKGLIEECSEVIKDYPKSSSRDAALISKAQRIEHYEISAYGTICTFAKELGHKDIASLLHETLNEESSADKKLTKLAEGGFLSSGINHDANLPTKSVKAKANTSAASNQPNALKKKAVAVTSKVASLTKKAVAAAKNAVTPAKKPDFKKKTTAVKKKVAAPIKKAVASAKTHSSKAVVKSKAKAKAPLKKSLAKNKASASQHHRRA